MANKSASFRFGGKDYTIRFSNNAMLRLQEALKEPLPRWIQSHFQDGQTGREVYLSGVDVQYLFWAGLEGARIWLKANQPAVTLFEAGDILEEILDVGGEVAVLPSGDSIQIGSLVMDCFLSGLTPAKPRIEGTGETTAVADPPPITGET